MSDDHVPCNGCGKMVPESMEHYLHFCPSCVKGASYFSVVSEFSPCPAGVTLEDGQNSAERLRGLLEARLGRARLTVDMNRTRGFGSSFLEATFTALGARMALTPEHITIRCDDTSIIKEVGEYLSRRSSPLLDRINDAQLRRRREADLKEALYKACTEWDESKHSKEALVARILKELPDPKANLKPWKRARHKTRMGTYELRRTRNGYDVRELGSTEHESGVDPRYVHAEFVEET